MNIVTLTLSCAFDIHCTADKLTLNHENLASIISSDAGGKGVNISRALTKFGTKNTAVAVLGEDNGDSFERALKNEGITLYPIWDKGRIRENITVHTDDGRETRLSFRGSPVSKDVFSKVTKTLHSLCNSETLLTVTGRVPDGIEIGEVKALIKELSKNGVKVVIDSRSFTLADLIDTKPYLIKPNEEEIDAYIEELNDLKIRETDWLDNIINPSPHSGKDSEEMKCNISFTLLDGTTDELSFEKSENGRLCYKGKTYIIRN